VGWNLSQYALAYLGFSNIVIGLLFGAFLSFLAVLLIMLMMLFGEKITQQAKNH